MSSQKQFESRVNCENYKGAPLKNCHHSSRLNSIARLSQVKLNCEWYNAEFRHLNFVGRERAQPSLEKGAA
jgi:hypothetical protein